MFSKTAQRSLSTIASSLQSLRIQPSHYAKIKIQDKSYIVQKGDQVHLPVKLAQCSVGDTLKLTHATSIGSRDFTVRGTPYVDNNLFECSAVITEHTKQPMAITIKKKRRNRHAKVKKNKQPYTVLRITELLVKSVPEAMAV